MKRGLQGRYKIISTVGEEVKAFIRIRSRLCLRLK